MTVELAVMAAEAPAVTSGGRGGGVPELRRRGGAWSEWGFCASKQVKRGAEAEAAAEDLFVEEVSVPCVSVLLRTCFFVWLGDRSLLA